MTEKERFVCTLAYAKLKITERELRNTANCPVSLDIVDATFFRVRWSTVSGSETMCESPRCSAVDRTPGSATGLRYAARLDAVHRPRNQTVPHLPWFRLWPYSSVSATCRGSANRIAIYPFQSPPDSWRNAAASRRFRVSLSSTPMT